MSGHGGGHGKGKKHKGHEEEHENHERWLVSYADMLTLLFVLFVVLYAISSVNQQKFDALKDGMAKGFGSPIGGLSGSTGALSDPGVDPLAIDQSVAQTVTGGAKTTGAPSKAAIKEAEKLLKNKELAKKLQEDFERSQKLQDLQKKLDAQLKKQGLDKTVVTEMTSRGVVIHVLTSNVVFAPDSAVLRPQGQQILAALTPVLNSVDNDISVEGNTDTTAAHPKGYVSEYNLAADRACNVVDYLDAAQHLPRSRMTCTSNADQNPRFVGTTPEINALNRRVDVVVLADSTAKDTPHTLGADDTSVAQTVAAQDSAQSVKDAATSAPKAKPATPSTPAAASSDKPAAASSDKPAARAKAGS